MLHAVVRFEQTAKDAAGRAEAIAWQDSALLHARKLMEFAAAKPDADVSEAEWALGDIFGTHRRKVPGNLARFLNSWVVHLGAPSASRLRWPKDLEGNVIANDDKERLSKVAEVVLRLLKPKHRTTTLQTDAGVAYVELLDRANDYFEQRTPKAFSRLTCDD